MANEISPDVLFIGTNEPLREALLKPLSSCNVVDAAFDLDALADPVDPHPCLILCSPPLNDPLAMEAGQLLRMNYSNAKVLLVASTGHSYNKKDLVKNGFDDLIVFPLDRQMVLNRVEEILAAAGAKVCSFRSVKLIDIAPNTALDFDLYLYLPANSKHLRYSSAGDELSSDQAKRLSNHKVNSIRVPTTQINRFYKYTADRLKSIGESDTISDTEKRERLQGSVRNIMAGMFTAEATSTVEGKEAIDGCKSIISNYITNTPSGKWYQRIVDTTADSTSYYSHSSNVSTFAALFSIALGIGKPDELALAGLLHDIGLARLPLPLLDKAPESFSEEEKQAYQKHPELAVTIVQERKLVLPEIVLKMILQHHEAFDGSGYPKGLAGARILPESQLLALADQFDELTAVIEGKPRISPAAAIDMLRKQCNDNPGKAKFDPELIRKLGALFENQSDEKAAA